MFKILSVSQSSESSKLEEVYLNGATKIPFEIQTSREAVPEEFTYESRKGGNIFTKTINVEGSPDQIDLILEYDSGKTFTKEIVI